MLTTHTHTHRQTDRETDKNVIKHNTQTHTHTHTHTYKNNMQKDDSTIERDEDKSRNFKLDRRMRMS